MYVRNARGITVLPEGSAALAEQSLSPCPVATGVACKSGHTKLSAPDADGLGARRLEPALRQSLL